MKTLVFPKNFTRSHRVHEVIIITLLAVISFFFVINCDNNPQHENIGFIPVGEWIGPDDWGEPDIYIITNTKITYVDPYNFNNFSGAITASIDFTNDAGVIIIKILEYPAPDTYTPNKYTCVYYRDYTSSNVKLAPPLDIC